MIEKTKNKKPDSSSLKLLEIKNVKIKVSAKERVFPKEELIKALDPAKMTQGGLVE